MISSQAKTNPPASFLSPSMMTVSIDRVKDIFQSFVANMACRARDDLYVKMYGGREGDLEPQPSLLAATAMKKKDYGY